MSEFKKGHVIWAKIRGYPWWPGVVNNLVIKFISISNL
jgi:hypothetical protein